MRAPGWRGLLPRGYRLMAIEVEHTRYHGAAVGLGPEQVEEVITAWVRHYEETGQSVSWPRVRQAMRIRANRGPWEPG